MGINAVPRRRNLRPRRPWSSEELGAPERKVRRARAKVSPGDFLVFDNEEDLDYEGGALRDDDAEIEVGEEQGSRSRSRRRPIRNKPREPKSVEKPRTRNRKLASKATESSRRGSRRRRGRVILDDEDEEEDTGSGVEDDEEEDASVDGDSEEDEDGYDSEEDVAAFGSASRRRSGKQRRHLRKVKVLLPEDVVGRELQPNQPEPDPEEVKYSPSVAFIAIFVATFIDLFPDLPTLPAPQDIEEGLLSEEPSALVEFIFRRLLGLVLNRKKEIEQGRYSSALSELHSLRHALGMGSMFPPLNWKSRGNAFAELNWSDRAELLHVLVHWSLASSDRVRQLLKTLNEDSTTPWMGADDAGNHYYIVGFDPLSEGAQEHTRFRVYRETNRLLSTVKWEPVASNSYEVTTFLQAHEIKPEAPEEPKVELEHNNPEEATKKEEPELASTDETNAEAPEAEPEPAAEAPVEPAEAPVEPEPVKYDLPDSVVEILKGFLPSMQLSERVAMERMEREAKRARRKRDLQYHTEAIARGEGRYAGRFRRRRTNYSEFLKTAYGGVSDNDEDDSDDTSSGRRSRRRLRHRGDDYAWREPEPETREQRHARLLAERAERDAQSRQTSVVSRDETQSDFMEVDSTPEPFTPESSRGASAEVVRNIEEPASNTEGYSAPQPLPITNIEVPSSVGPTHPVVPASSNIQRDTQAASIPQLQSPLQQHPPQHPQPQQVAQPQQPQELPQQLQLQQPQSFQQLQLQPHQQQQQQPQQQQHQQQQPQQQQELQPHVQRELHPQAQQPQQQLQPQQQYHHPILEPARSLDGAPVPAYDSKGPLYPSGFSSSAQPASTYNEQIHASIPHAQSTEDAPPAPMTEQTRPSENEFQQKN